MLFECKSFEVARFVSGASAHRLILSLVWVQPTLHFRASIRLRGGFHRQLEPDNLAKPFLRIWHLFVRLCFTDQHLVTNTHVLSIGFRRRFPSPSTALATLSFSSVSARSFWRPA